MQGWVFELIGQKTKTRNIRRPAKTRWFETFDGDFDRITGFRPINKDRTGNRIDFTEIQCGHIRNRTVKIELASSTVHTFKFNGGSRRDRLHGRDRMIPPVMMVRGVDRVIRTFAHVYFTAM